MQMTTSTLNPIPISKLPKSGVEINFQQIQRLGLSRQRYSALQFLCRKGHFETKDHHRSWSFGAMAGLAALKTPLQLDKVVLTEYQVEKAKHEMDKFINPILANPDKREKATPYYQLHKEGDVVFGTAMIFHGFSAQNDQMRRLAQYLFENGLNVYLPCLAGHYFLKPDKYWPQVDFKKSLKERLTKKLMADPKLFTIMKDFTSIALLTPEQVNDTLACLRAMKPSEDELLAAINDEDYGELFYMVYESQHMKYLHEAEQRLKEVDSLPGPVFTVGISMGGATALALAATHPDKIARTAVFAPLLKIKNQTNRKFSTLAGPLGAHECGWYPDMPFTAKCFTCVDVFAHFVREDKHLDLLSKMPTFIVQTEIDDSADPIVGQRVVKEIQARTGKGGPPHYSVTYPAASRVPHTMVDPTETSQGTTNTFWQSLYQETFRFLTQGTVDAAHVNNRSQDPNLPRVAPR